ncbi:hypothetical protein Leryth_018371, partial [Lithospermum erythrorhizon]
FPLCFILRSSKTYTVINNKISTPHPHTIHSRHTYTATPTTLQISTGIPTDPPPLTPTNFPRPPANSSATPHRAPSPLTPNHIELT